MAERRDPFAAPPFVWVMLVVGAGLTLAGVLVDARQSSASPVALRVGLSVFQFVFILGAPFAAGAWWGRGRPRTR